MLRLREEVEGSEMSIGSMTTGDLAAMVAGLARARYCRSNSCSSGVSVEVWLGIGERGLVGSRWAAQVFGGVFIINVGEIQ